MTPRSSIPSRVRPEWLGLLGINFRTCPVEIRERLSVPSSQVTSALTALLASGAHEAVILATCNRVEFYWVAENGGAIASKWRSEWERTSGEDLASRVYVLQGFDATQHLFKVAAGLDSMVLGEVQILGQVKAAYQAALAAGATGPCLNRVFQKALHAGKRARSETGIAHGISSVASAAVILAERIFSDLNSCKVMVLGAGKMAESAARHLASHKMGSLSVANRTLEKAQALAAELGAEAVAWEQAMERMPGVDIAICSTACPTHIFKAEQVASWMRERRGRPLFLIDIAVPRNVPPEVHRLENVFLYDIDDLNDVVADQAARKNKEAQKAEEIVLTVALETWQAAGRAVKGAPIWRPRPEESPSS